MLTTMEQSTASHAALPQHRLSETSPGNWVSRQARHAPHRRCLVSGDGTVYTFGEINSRVNRLARALRDRGIVRHDRIAILATDSVDYMCLLLASMKLGTTYVPLNYRFAPSEVALLAKAGEFDAFVTMRRYGDFIGPVRSACRNLKLTASFDECDGLETIAGMIASVSDDSDVEVCTDSEDIVSLMFTSGTTGRPKGVMQSMRMIGQSSAAAIIDFGFGRDEFRYSASPMFHAAGMGCVYYGLARGFCSLILEQYDAGTLLHWMSDGGLTGALMMPTMLRALLDLEGVRERKYPALRSIAYGGSPITPALLREALDVFDCDFFNTFGAGTEAAGQAMFYPDDHLRALASEEHLLGSIGHPMYGVELRLVDEDMNDVAPGEIGEICTRSDSVMSGYLNDPERTARAVVDGWFRAGDLAWRDEEGFLFLAGRSTDMIIRGGENVYPVEIESVLADHPSIATVAVVGLPDAHWGEVVVAAIELARGAELDDAALREHCRARLAAYKVPSVIVVVDTLPRNVNGKVQKHLLIEQLKQSG